MVSIYISLMTDDTERLFSGLMVICISNLMEHLFKSFVHFFIGLFFLIWRSMCSLYILDLSLLLYIHIENILSSLWLTYHVLKGVF